MPVYPGAHRGRDAGHPAPPAQIRARAPNAHGSWLGSVTKRQHPFVRRFGPCDTYHPALCRDRARPLDVLLAPGPFLPNLRRRFAPLCSAGSQVLWPGQTPLQRTRPPFGLAPSRTALDSIERLQRSPGSRACCFSTCSGSLTTQGRTSARDLPRTPVWPSHLRHVVGALEQVIFRSSIARPADAPIYASVDASRRPPQDSGSRWFATPSL